MLRSRPLIFCCILFLVSLPLSSADEPVVVLTHATVIDATGAPAQPDMTVVIANGRIAEIGMSSSVRSPKNAQRIDATGKFVIPGLWDMHAHWDEAEYLPLFLANGVTGMRIMWGDATHHEWRRQVEAGTLLAPHMVIASAIIDGPKPFWQASISVASEKQARHAVINEQKGGADFIKVYTALPRAEYFAIAQECKRRGISFVGHVPWSVRAEEASNAGQKSIEHLTGILRACSTRESDLNEARGADLADRIVAQHPTASSDEHFKTLRQIQLDTYSAEKAATLFALFKKNGTWQVPTLTVLRSLAYVDDLSFTSDPRLKYMPPSLRSEWNPTTVANLYGFTPEDFAFAKKEFAKDLELVSAMQKAGVGILAGTDTMNPFCFPGFSLHDELGLLVKAGLTPMQALQTATLNSARFLKTEKDFGTVERGKVADLLLLDGNPLDDIANTRKINAVIYGGKLLPRAQLDRMLAEVEALAACRTLQSPRNDRGTGEVRWRR